MPDGESARVLARRLVDERLAACVHVQDVASTYRWAGKVEQEDEVLVEARTTLERADLLRKRILSLHPYEVPLVEVVEAFAIPPTYMDWAAESVAPAR